MAKLGSAAGFIVAGVDLAGDGNSIRVSAARDTHEVNVFNSGGWKNYLGGLCGVTFDFGGYHNAAAGKQNATLWPLLTNNTPQALDVRPAGTTGGVDMKYTCNSYLTKYDINSQPTAAIVMSATFLADGQVTRIAI